MAQIKLLILRRTQLKRSFPLSFEVNRISEVKLRHPINRAVQHTGNLAARFFLYPIVDDSNRCGTIKIQTLYRGLIKSFVARDELRLHRDSFAIPHGVRRI